MLSAWHTVTNVYRKVEASRDGMGRKRWMMDEMSNGLWWKDPIEIFLV